MTLLWPQRDIIGKQRGNDASVEAPRFRPITWGYRPSYLSIKPALPGGEDLEIDFRRISSESKSGFRSSNFFSEEWFTPKEGVKSADFRAKPVSGLLLAAKRAILNLDSQTDVWEIFRGVGMGGAEVARIS